MRLAIADRIFRTWRILASLGLGVTAVVATGCAVRVEREQRPVVVQERPVVVRERPARVTVEQPVAEVVVEPVAEVVFEPAPAEVVATYETDLTPLGHWTNVASYGRCWSWHGRHSGWRPYTVGHWTASEEGWLWVAEGEELEFGATCYHYGRWFEDPAEGWVWVPGRVWAPSWCAWREGDGYSAWAPLPPECGDNHIISAEVVERYCPPERFVCVETRNITNVNIHTTIVRDVTIIRKTTNITKITYVNNRAVNHGVDVKVVEKATGHPVHVEKTIKVSTAAEAHREQAAGHAVVYTPTVVESYHKAHPIVTKTVHKETGQPGVIHKDPIHAPGPAAHGNKEDIHKEPVHTPTPAVKEHKEDVHKEPVHTPTPAVKEHKEDVHKEPVHTSTPAVKEHKEDVHKEPVHTPTPAVKEHKEDVHKEPVHTPTPAVKEHKEDVHKEPVHTPTPAVKEHKEDVHKEPVHTPTPAVKEHKEDVHKEPVHTPAPPAHESKEDVHKEPVHTPPAGERKPEIKHEENKPAATPAHDPKKDPKKLKPGEKPDDAK